MSNVSLTRPLLLVGTLLVALGLGNWVVSRDKLLEYTERVRSSNAVATARPIDGLPRLDPAQSSALIEWLHRRPDNYSLAKAKLDFYQVVHVGGQVFAALGLVIIVVGLARDRHERGSHPDKSVSGIASAGP